MKRVLVVAYYVPPLGLSGVQRVAKLVKYLPRFGWQPTLLCPEPGAYFAHDPTLLAEIEAAGVEILRTPSLDPTRIAGGATTVALPQEGTRRRLTTLSQFVFVPDNKIGWLPFAVAAGRKALKRRRYEAILSSAPPYTGHLIGAALSALSGLPLWLDYRDDWVGNPRHVYPTPAHRWLQAMLERFVMRRADRVTTINDVIAADLAERHPEGARPVVLPQGFDPEDFAVAPMPRTGDTCRFLYTGVFYDAQTPDYFLRALARLLDREPRWRSRVEAVFVGLLPEPSQQLVAELGLSDVVRWEGYLPHPETVRHLSAADVLWMTVGRRAGAESISTGKLYEYMGSRKPILALVPDGAARRDLEPYGAAHIAPPDDLDAIEAELAELVRAWEGNRLPRPNERYVRRFDREAIAQDVADTLNDWIPPRA